MVRRDFLKLSGLFSAALAVQIQSLPKLPSLPLEVVFKGKVYRGTSDGKIYVSSDAGKSWSLHSGFGSDTAITGLSVDNRKRLVALLTYQGYDFRIFLAPQAQAWRTM